MRPRQPRPQSRIEVSLFVCAGSEETPLSGVVVRALSPSGFAVQFQQLALLQQIADRNPDSR